MGKFIYTNGKIFLEVDSAPRAAKFKLFPQVGVQALACPPKQAEA
jgi:hypothetical protein